MFADTVNALVEPYVTDCAVFGVTVPPVPVLGVTVYELILHPAVELPPLSGIVDGTAGDQPVNV